jgi:two-component system response regulator LytT
MKLNCVVIEDEPLAMGLISAFIEQTSFLHLFNTYSSAVTALAELKQEQVHLIFLDIQMPNLNGIELARKWHQPDPARQSRIIFTTAYSQFAIESYRVDALDYLLKPFDYQDFLRAANKALAYFEQLDSQKTIPGGHIFVRVEYQLVKIDLDDILFIEGLKDYIKIHLASSPKAILTLMTMKSLEEKLPSPRFARVQRSFIVALDKISAITKHMIRIGDAEIPIGEQYKTIVQEFRNKLL